MPTESANRDPRQFSLRELFKLTLIVALVLAAGVLARDSQHFHWLWSLWTLVSLVAIVAVWLVHRLRLIQPRTLAWWSIAMYGLSMLLPAVELGGEPPFRGDYFGWECFLLTFLFIVEGIGIPGAAANTAFIVGCLFLFNGLERKDTTRLTKAWWWSTFGTLMAVASLLVFPEFEAKVLYPGYWLWLASMLAAALAARGARLGHAGQDCRF